VVEMIQELQALTSGDLKVYGRFEAAVEGRRSAREMIEASGFWSWDKTALSEDFPAANHEGVQRKSLSLLGLPGPLVTSELLSRMSNQEIVGAQVPYGLALFAPDAPWPAHEDQIIVIPDRFKNCEGTEIFLAVRRQRNGGLQLRSCVLQHREMNELPWVPPHTYVFLVETPAHLL
jgi:hypothetical protein